MTFEETANSIRTQRHNLMRLGLVPSHVVFGFADWDSFRADARSQDLIAYDFLLGRAETVMGLRVVYTNGSQEAKVLTDGAQS
jgi:hypothetical protein